MKLLIQRVSEAKVEVDKKIVGQINQGLLVFLGIHSQDTPKEVKWLAEKLVNLRVFADEQGKMNKSTLELKNELLIVSQFTLYADCLAGRRPSFTNAALPSIAEPLYELFIEELKKFSLKVEKGLFGAHMNISLTNDGPVTFIIEK